MTTEEEAELIAGFLSLGPAAEQVFVVRFQPFLQDEVKYHWKRFIDRIGELEQAALLKLYEMRETESGRAEIRPPFTALARRLIQAPARAMSDWRKRMLPLKDWDAPIAGAQEPDARLRELLEIASTLPRGMAKTMELHAMHCMGMGPPLHEALGIDRDAARRRLTRAQAAAMAIANGEEVEIQDE